MTVSRVPHHTLLRYCSSCATAPLTNRRTRYSTRTLTPLIHSPSSSLYAFDDNGTHVWPPIFLIQRFVLKQKSYNQQFSHVYVNRLLRLRAAVAERVAADANAPRVLPKIIDLRDGDECVIIGTVLKVLQAKPDLFEALLSEDGITPIEHLGTSLASDDDQLVLEDESGRVELVGDVDIGQLVTGVVLGVRGVMRAGANAFSVQQVYAPAFPPQPALPVRTESAYVALVSGLSLGRHSADTSPLRTHVLVDYLAGRLGDAGERQFVASIVRTIVVGNSVAPLATVSSQAATKKKSVEELALDAEPMKNVDELLSSLACAMCVDVLPGPSDPSNYTLPQQSFHPCLFPRSARFASFRAVTNPYEAEIGGVGFFGHAGQPLDSLLQCTMRTSGSGAGAEDDGAIEMMGDSMETDADDSALDCLESCLQWRHAAPTAPDLVACFPMATDDPFILETCPHVLFAGNQKRFSTRLATGTYMRPTTHRFYSVLFLTLAPCFLGTPYVHRRQERARAADQCAVVRRDVDDRARGPERPLVFSRLDLIVIANRSFRKSRARCQCRWTAVVSLTEGMVHADKNDEINELQQE